MSPIVLWSAAGGFMLGAIADALLLGIAVCVGALIPSLTQRATSRLGVAILLVVAVAIPLATATLGMLEGRLKLQ